MSASLYTDALAPFLAEVERLRPTGGEVFDAHTHLGLDEDGRSLDLQTLLSQLDDAGARRACVFPLHDPERKPSYSVPNDRVLAWAGESENRLIPFCRLDPAEAPVAEGERCIAKGARGIKLHPRAQAFAFDGPEMDGIFTLAEQARVPILIHAGRGMPPIADGLADLALRHPEVVLILAHGAICDQGILTSRLADHPGVLYDTSCFFPVDLIELLARVPVERIVFASDPPYGLTASGLYLALRVAAHAGLDEQATRAIMGGTIASLVDRKELPPTSPPRGRRADRDVGSSRPRIRLCEPRRARAVRGYGRSSQGNARAGDRGVPRSATGSGWRGARADRRGVERGARAARRTKAPSVRRSTCCSGRWRARLPICLSPRQPQRRPLPALTTRSLAQAKTRSERHRNLVGLLAQQPTRDQIEIGGRA